MAVAPTTGSSWASSTVSLRNPRTFFLLFFPFAPIKPISFVIFLYIIRTIQKINLNKFDTSRTGVRAVARPLVPPSPPTNTPSHGRCVRNIIARYVSSETASTGNVRGDRRIRLTAPLSTGQRDNVRFVANISNKPRVSSFFDIPSDVLPFFPFVIPVRHVTSRLASFTFTRVLSVSDRVVGRRAAACPQNEYCALYRRITTPTR